jgi:hypothetical protein
MSALSRYIMRSVMRAMGDGAHTSTLGYSRTLICSPNPSTGTSNHPLPPLTTPPEADPRDMCWTIRLPHLSASPLQPLQWQPSA